MQYSSVFLQNNQSKCAGTVLQGRAVQLVWAMHKHHIHKHVFRCLRNVTELSPSFLCPLNCLCFCMPKTVTPFTRPLSFPSQSGCCSIAAAPSCLLLLSALSGRWLSVDSFAIGMPAACDRCMWALPYWHTFYANEHRSDEGEDSRGGSTWREGGAHRDCCLLPSRALYCSRSSSLQHTPPIGLEPSRACPTEHHIKQPEHRGCLFSKASWGSHVFGLHHTDLDVGHVSNLETHIWLNNLKKYDVWRTKQWQGYKRMFHHYWRNVPAPLWIQLTYIYTCHLWWEHEMNIFAFLEL